MKVTTNGLVVAEFMSTFMYIHASFLPFTPLTSIQTHLWLRVYVSSSINHGSWLYTNWWQLKYDAYRTLIYLSSYHENGIYGLNLYRELEILCFSLLLIVYMHTEHMLGISSRTSTFHLPYGLLCSHQMQNIYAEMFWKKINLLLTILNNRKSVLPFLVLGKLRDWSLLMKRSQRICLNDHINPLRIH